MFELVFELVLDLVHSQNGLLLVDWLFIASPSQTSQHARPCAHLVHSQNGCLLLVYSLFVDSLPKLPRMPDLVLTLCARQHIHIVHRRERHDTTEHDSSTRYHEPEARARGPAG